MTESVSAAPQGGSEPTPTASEGAVSEASEGSGGENEEIKAPPPNRHKVKVNGKEEDADIEELKAAYSKVKAADERFRTAAEERKAAEKERAEAKALLEKVKSDPWAVMKELGLDPRKTSEEYLIKQLELDAMSPEQKAAMEKASSDDKKRAELEAKLKEYEDREKKDKDEKEQAEIAAQSQKIAKDYEEQFLEALGSTKLPKTQKTVALVAEKLREAIVDGYEISVKQAVKAVEREQKAALNAILADADPDIIAELIGEEGVKKLRKRDVEKLKNPIPQSQNREEPQHKEKEKPQSPEEWLKSVRKQHGILR
jgi:hypothetical protein